MDASQDGQSLPPAGWFADAQNPALERWWDGVKWTEYQRNREVAPPPPVAPAAPAYAPPGPVQPAAYASTVHAAYPVAPPQPFAGSRRPGLSTLGRKAATVGIVAGGLFMLGFLMLILGGVVAQLNFLLWLGIFAFFAAFLCGIVAVILGIVAATRRN